MSATMLSERLKAKRRELGFSLRDVERIVDNELSNAYISQLENGKIKNPSAHAIICLCAAYGLGIADALEWMGTPVKIMPPRICETCGQALPLDYAIDASRPIPAEVQDVAGLVDELRQAGRNDPMSWNRALFNKAATALERTGEFFARDANKSGRTCQESLQVGLQARVQPWLLECFGAEIAADQVERCDRFIEEALELIQSLGHGSDRAHALVDYVFGRPVGEPRQEVGGVMVTLAALCLAAGLDMHEAGETELARINVPETVAKIRAKQAAKPTGSALPIAQSPHPKGTPDDGK